MKHNVWSLGGEVVEIVFDVFMRGTVFHCLIPEFCSEICVSFWSRCGCQHTVSSESCLIIHEYYLSAAKRLASCTLHLVIGNVGFQNLLLFTAVNTSCMCDLFVTWLHHQLCTKLLVRSGSSPHRLQFCFCFVFTPASQPMNESEV